MNLIGWKINKERQTAIFNCAFEPSDSSIKIGTNNV